MPALPRDDARLSPGVGHVPVLALGLEPLNAALGVEEQRVRGHGVGGQHDLEGVDLKWIEERVLVKKLSMSWIINGMIN